MHTQCGTQAQDGNAWARIARGQEHNWDTQWKTYKAWHKKWE